MSMKYQKKQQTIVGIDYSLNSPAICVANDNFDFKKKLGFQTPVKDWVKDNTTDQNQILNNDWYNYMKLVFNLFNKI